MADRISKLNRETGETKVSVELNINGAGRYRIDTTSGMFDHMLAQLARHGLMDLNLSAEGDTHVDWHHLVEDVGILMGRALKEAVGDARGITRMAHAYVPLDEALALSVVDFGGRGHAEVDVGSGDGDLGDLTMDLLSHFLETLAREGAFNLHARVLAGVNSHHKAEALFKSLARALRAALALDPRVSGEIPSTKDVIG